MVPACPHKKNVGQPVPVTLQYHILKQKKSRFHLGKHETSLRIWNTLKTGLILVDALHLGFNIMPEILSQNSFSLLNNRFIIIQ